MDAKKIVIKKIATSEKDSLWSIFNKKDHIEIWYWFYQKIQDKFIKPPRTEFSWEHVQNMVNLLEDLEIELVESERPPVIPFPTEGTQ